MDHGKSQCVNKQLSEHKAVCIKDVSQTQSNVWCWQVGVTSSDGFIHTTLSAEHLSLCGAEAVLNT